MYQQKKEQTHDQQNKELKSTNKKEASSSFIIYTATKNNNCLSFNYFFSPHLLIVKWVRASGDNPFLLRAAASIIDRGHLLRAREGALTTMEVL